MLRETIPEGAQHFALCRTHEVASSWLIRSAAVLHCLLKGILGFVFSRIPLLIPHPCFV